MTLQWRQRWWWEEEEGQEEVQWEWLPPPPSLKLNKWPWLLVSNQSGCKRQGRVSIKNLIAEMLREENPDWTLKDPQPLINIHPSRHGDAAGDQIKERRAVTTAQCVGCDIDVEV